MQNLITKSPILSDHNNMISWNLFFENLYLKLYFHLPSYFVYINSRKIFLEYWWKNLWIYWRTIIHQHCVKNVLIRSYSARYFPAFGLNTERYERSIQLNCFVNETFTREIVFWLFIILWLELVNLKFRW